MYKLIKDDELIREFAQNQLSRLGEPSTRRVTDLNNLRTKLRTLGRLLVKAKELSSNVIITLEQLIRPQSFELLIEAAKLLCVNNNQMALTVGNYIQRLNLLKLSKAIRLEDEKVQTEGEQFKYLYQCHWNSRITAVAAKKQKLSTLNRSEELPLKKDLQLLGQHMREKIRYFESKGDLSELSKHCLALLIVFNKRRPMEVSDIEVENFLEQMGKSYEETPEVLDTLDETEKAVAAR